MSDADRYGVDDVARGRAAPDQWPQIKTAAALVSQGIVPCSVPILLQVAKRHGVGRKLGRTYIFTPDDITRLLGRLPLPSGSLIGSDASTVAPVPAALEKALTLASQPRQKRR